MNRSVEFVPTSQLFWAIVDNAPGEQVTLAWLLGNLRRRSFGMIMLVLGLIAMIPGICILAGFVLGVLGAQMIMARETPLLPRFLARHPLSTRRIAKLLGSILPVMEALETFIRPRWHTPFVATKRLVGLIVVLLAVTVFMPIPFSNIIPGGLTMLVAFAYLEQDGIMLCIALMASVGSLAITGAEGWAAVAGAGFLLRN